MNQATSIISALSTEKQQQVIEQTYVYIEQAVDLFNIKDKTFEISFNLKGRAAGMYRVRRHGGWHFALVKREIRYNSFIFSKYYDDNFNTTIPHEVAHYVSDMIYGLKNIKPHGKEWKAIMQAFGANTAVTASYDLSGIPLRKQTVFTYQCCCKEHQLSAIRHNKIKNRRYRYYCKSCKQVLQHKQQEKTCV
jgi:SprT protein